MDRFGKASGWHEQGNGLTASIPFHHLKFPRSLVEKVLPALNERWRFSNVAGHILYLRFSKCALFSQAVSSFLRWVLQTLYSISSILSTGFCYPKHQHCQTGRNQSALSSGVSSYYKFPSPHLLCCQDIPAEEEEEEEEKAGRSAGRKPN